MSKLTDIKTVLVTALRGLSYFTGNEADVHAYRFLQLENEQDQVASRLKGLSAFVSIDRIKRDSGDSRILKQATAVVELWINTHTQATTGLGNAPAEELLEAAIAAMDGLVTTSPQLACHFKSEFQDAYTVMDAPSPFLVYRLIITTNTIITNE